MQASRDILSVEDLLVKFQPVNGTTLGYIEKGEGDAIVFVHGAVCDLRIWLDQVELFSQNYRAISYSRRSHWPAAHHPANSGYLRTEHARDLICFLEALHLKKAHVVGHSFGAAVALLAAIERPDLIRTLTLGEPSPFLGLFDESELDLISRQKIGFDEARVLARSGQATDAVRKFLSVIVGADVLDQLPPTAKSVVSDNASTLSPMLEHYFESPSLDCDHLNRITFPTLLISGEFSPRLALLGNRRLNDCLPNSHEVILPSISHGLHIEDPKSFSRVVKDFIDDFEIARQNTVMGFTKGE
jgi:pimeloyl-ACP methyl ester carboxylesterase